ncbi:MAG: AAA family ATPase [Bacteroidota bacterium]
MLIQRSLSTFLHHWKQSRTNLPLILRGARQVGKTTLINEFGKSYEQYLYFNLEKERDSQLFEASHDIDTLIQLLFLSRQLQHNPELNTLIFIDEVQENPQAIEALRYFKEEYPHLDVIATGSLLEFGLNKISRVPVGRVEYAELHPLSFREYLQGMDNQVALDCLEQIPFESPYLSTLYPLFHRYTLIGGMPGIASAYLQENDLSRIRPLYASIIESYKEDVEKYATNDSQKRVIRHIMDTAPYEIDNRIKLNLFGASSFKTREIKEAMNALSKARLLELIYPTTQTQAPIIPDFRKRPRLHFLDIGLVSYQLGLHQELLTIKDLNDSSRGKIVQQVVNQELKAQTILPGTKRAFWVREERGTSAEVDIVYPFRHMLIPIEVKSGASGRLRSLHEFIDRCPHHFAVRMYKGDIRIDELSTRKGKSFRLLNLPYFLAGWLEQYLDWFVQ